MAGGGIVHQAEGKVRDQGHTGVATYIGLPFEVVGKPLEFSIEAVGGEGLVQGRMAGDRDPLSLKWSEPFRKSRHPQLTAPDRVGVRTVEPVDTADLILATGQVGFRLKNRVGVLDR